MTAPPLVSVVIPAKNEAADIVDALGGVAAQDIDLATVEVVVVDGDSEDRTNAVAAGALESMGLARWAVVPNPGGNTPSNLNCGLDWAAGTYVVRVDARSLLPSDYIRRTVAILQERPEVSVVGGSQVAVPRDASAKAAAIATALNNPLAMGGSRYRRDGSASGRTDTVYLGVFRRAQLIDAGGWDEHFSTNQDFDLNQRMAAFGHVWFEADLPVAYLPRGTIGALALQYHRFGRWKAHYWRRTQQSPNRRQQLLLALPPAAGAVVVAMTLLLGARRSLALTGTGVMAAAVTGKVNHLWAWAINVVVAIAWWSGVVRGLARDDVAP
ncbi:MAG: glycosyltransferase [Acidimicrobiales bacterium]